MKKTISRAAVILFWLAVWQAAAVWVGNRILLAGPAEVCARIGRELGQASFYTSIAGSLVRIMAGFGLGMITGMVIGACAFFWRALKQLLEPVILAMKSVPVAAFVILVLIWSGSKNLAVPISFLVVFPYFYIHMLTGLAGTDSGQLMFARVSGMRRLNRMLYVYRPALAPYVLGAARVTIGMSFKSGIAAEVIGIPEFAIGTRLYMSKVYLDTAGVLAWTVVVVLLSFACEKIILCLLRALFSMHVRPLSGRRKSSVRVNAVQDAQGIAIPALRKTYQGKTVVDLPEMRIRKGGRMAIVGGSGSGKTTWLKLLMGLEQPDKTHEEAEAERTAVGSDVRKKALQSAEADVRKEALQPAEADVRKEALQSVGTGVRKQALQAGEEQNVSEAPCISPAFQDDCLFMEETAADNVRMVCAAQNVGQAGECLGQLLPVGAAGQRASELSGGMCRRVAVARAVLAGGSLLLLDEPFRGLDTENKKRLAAFILKNQADRALVFAVHDESEAALLAPEKTVCLRGLTF